MVYVGEVTKRETVHKVYVKGEGYNKAFTYDEFITEFQEKFGEFRNVVEFAKNAGFIIIDDVAYAHCVSYRGQREDGYKVYPSEFTYQRRNSSGHLITECLLGIPEVNDLGLLHGVFNGDDEDSIVADLRAEGSEELFNSLREDDVIGYEYTTYGNYWYPVTKGEVNRIYLPAGYQVDYQA